MLRMIGRGGSLQGGADLGQVSGLPVGLSFPGPAWSEPALIGLAYAYEQASQALTWPTLRGTAGAGVCSGS